MGTSLTPEFWRQSAVLLVIAMAVTFVLSGALDALVLRSRQHRVPRRPSGTGTVGAVRRRERTAQCREGLNPDRFLGPSRSGHKATFGGRWRPTAPRGPVGPVGPGRGPAVPDVPATAEPMLGTDPR
ncbi:hypothetical protein GCM10010306_100870 [Streptomyces umbrinus]|uniref:hypothetical protein n=1 Tax=Streptomyces umbrinus TaxID=67370 RepID=UPI0016749523|nr:hypothetical protein [Streptomyces umbrinus]GHB89530.1 hypothetical protein GCM10010306_100870 [Streptomyces umbrinus]